MTARVRDRSRRNVGDGARCSARDHRDGRKTRWMSGDYGVFLGLDVGKGAHHAVGLDPAGKRLHDVALPNSERKLRAVFDKLTAHGPASPKAGRRKLTTI